MLLGIEHAFWRCELKYLHLRADSPAVRSRAIAQFVFGFGEADVDAGFAGRGAGEQELQRDGRLAGAGTAFEKVQPVTGDAAAKNIVKTGNPGRGTW